MDHAARTWPAIEYQALVDSWRELVDLESGSNDAAGLRQIAEVMRNRLALLDFSVSTEGATASGAAHLVATRDGRGAPILLLGHLDTVWPPGTLGRNPFRIEDGLLLGPGVADMKGGLAVMLASLEAVAQLDDPPALRVVLTSDEELGSVTGRPVVEQQAIGCRAALVLEPGRPGGHFVDRRRGSGVFLLSVAGRTAHAANNPQDGINAIDELAHQLSEFGQWRDVDRGTYLMAGVIKGGTARQVVPDHAEALIDARAATPEDLDELVAWLRDREQQTTVPGVKVRVTGDVTRPVMAPAPGTEALRALTVKAGVSLGEKVTFTSGGGGSDANFTAAMGIPTVDGFGPVGHRLCSIAEAAEPETGVRRARLLAQVLSDLCSERP